MTQRPYEDPLEPHAETTSAAPPSGRERDTGAKLLGLIRAAQRRKVRDRDFRELAAAFRTTLGEHDGGVWRLVGRSLATGLVGSTAADSVLLERLSAYGVCGLEIPWDVSIEDLHRLALALAPVGPEGQTEPFPTDLGKVRTLDYSEVDPWFAVSGGAEAEAIQEDVRLQEEEVSIHRSLDQVLDVGVGVIEQAIGGLAPGEVDFETLQDVLGAAEQAIADTGSTVSQPLVPDGAVAEEDPELTHNAYSVEDLLGGMELLDQAAAKEGHLELETDTAAEKLSILLHMILDAEPEADALALLERLQRRVRADMSPEELRVVWGTFAGLMDAGDWRRMDTLFPIAARTLRFSNPPLVEQMVDVATAASSLGREVLWPHAANELLVARRERGDRPPAPLYHLVAGLAPGRLRDGVERLRRLDALNHGRVAVDAFQPRLHELYPLFAHLLASPEGALLGPGVLRGLRLSPPSPEWKVVVDALWGYRPTYTVLLSGILTFTVEARPPQALLNMASTVVADAVHNLEPGLRGEPWVPAALDWLGDRRFAPAAGLLKRVTLERRNLLSMAWPRDCRRSARRALRKILKQRTAR